MNMHRNSIQYRVRHTTELLPGASEDLRDDYNVRTVLMAAFWLGETVLA